MSGLPGATKTTSELVASRAGEVQWVPLISQLRFQGPLLRHLGLLVQIANTRLFRWAFSEFDSKDRGREIYQDTRIVRNCAAVQNHQVNRIAQRRDKNEKPRRHEDRRGSMVTAC